MKRLFLLFSVAICLCGMNGCKSKQALAKPEKGEVEIAIPLSGPQYQSDAENWRVVQQGVSPDMSMAKKVALQNARQELAATIRVQVRAVIDNYGKNTAVTDNIDVVNMYEEQAYSVIDQTLAGAELVGKAFAERAVKAKIADNCYFDRGSYRYHGRVKALCEAIRAGGVRI